MTRRGLLVLIGAAGCYVLGELADYAMFRALAGFAFGAVVAAVVTAMSRPRAEVTRTVHPDRVERGTPALATLVVRNTTTRRHGGFSARDRAGTTEHRVQVRPLATGAEATYHYELPTDRRGRLNIGPLVLNRSDPFRLVRTNRTIGTTTTVLIYPRRHTVRPAAVAFPRHHYDGPTTDPPLRGSNDLVAVREYVRGDEVRLLHWRSTAKTGVLMVREYTDPALAGVTVVLDTRAGALPAFEDAVEVATSLLYAGAQAGQRCRLITSTGANVATDSGLPGAQHMLDELCLVTQDADPRAGLVPPELATRRPSGSLIVLTGPEADLGRAAIWRPDTVFRLGVAGGRALGNVIAADTAERAVALWNTLRTEPAR
ncbi:hypothetical protein BLA60_14460 [Actinophytocola xinjiangensis]|uniref:DUF58 domain-containing protein n=1 Tax=Actinophytocola xinjiangensis TaxID=485602 RepID=A0A7Z1B007_9PSEU|nr:hypothetical protein BLA60_14460 [Actinophytocola xinjiangensis]